MSTPSAAAEMAVPDLADILAAIGVMVRTADSAMSASLQAFKIDVDGLRNRMERAVPDMDSMRMRVDELLRTSAAHLRSQVRSSSVHVDGLAARLEALSPVGTMSRGYAIVQAGPNGAVVSDSSLLAPGDRASVTLSRGGFDAEVVAVVEA